MKLQNGGVYLDRQGNKCIVWHQPSAHPQPFRDMKSGHRFTEEGFYIDKNTATVFDLVEEVGCVRPQTHEKFSQAVLHVLQGVDVPYTVTIQEQPERIRQVSCLFLYDQEIAVAYSRQIEDHGHEDLYIVGAPYSEIGAVWVWYDDLNRIVKILSTTV